MATLTNKTEAAFSGSVRRTSLTGRPGALRLGFLMQPGMKVGLFGGSFDPAHPGHAHVAETALRRLGLDRIIWLVTPQNPLKSARSTPLRARMASARRQARGPSMIVSDAETRIGARYTVDTLRVLKARYPGVAFVWIMGADNLAGFHRWKGWTDIVRLMPMAIVARPQAPLSRATPVSRRFRQAHRPSRAGRTFPYATAPAWTYLEGPLHFASSTALRAAFQPD